MRVVDMVEEAVTSIAVRPGRSALTALGTVLGVASFVGVLGLTATATGQISGRFDEFAATQVVMTDGRASSLDGPLLPADVERRVLGLHGVTGVGVSWQPREVRTIARTLLSGSDEGESVPVTAASPGYLAAVGTRITTGRAYDQWIEQTGTPVAVLGDAAARQLGISDTQAHPAVFIDGTAFTVVGIAGDIGRRQDLRFSVMVPTRVAAKLWGDPTPDDDITVLVTTRAGAARQVAAEVPAAVRPDNMALLVAHPPVDPHQLRDGVGQDLTGLFLALALLCLVVGAVGIANTTLVAVLERTPEIGIRRATGAQRRHVAIQFLAESSILGLLGGLVGTCLGVFTTLGYSYVAGWSPIQEITVLLIGPLLGLVTGLAAGVYPALRAAGVEPSEALRR